MSVRRIHTVSHAAEAATADAFQRRPIPWQQFVEFSRGMIGDTGEHISEPGLRVDVIHFRGHDQTIHDCGSLAAAIGTREQP